MNFYRGLKNGLIISCVLWLIIGLAISAFAKDYTVTVDDKYVEIFEGAFANETVTPTEWLGLQALNLIDQIVDRSYAIKEVKSKTRDEKITALKAR